MLTGPGGPFEVETDTVNGVEMKVYKSRMMSLREVAAMGAGRGDDPARPFLVYGAERMGFASFVGAANSVSSVLAEACGVGRGDRVAVLAANCPEWCLAFWGVVDMGAVLVGLNGWWKTDEILYGLRGQRVAGAGGGRAAVRAHRRLVGLAAGLGGGVRDWRWRWGWW